jgi:16S rRNA (cytosine1402-N4)-methyltransferase
MTANVATPHEPVMLQATLSELDPPRDAWVLDATFGAGGHSRALLERGARVLAIDRDPSARRYEHALRDRCPDATPERFRFVTCDFRDLTAALRTAGIASLHAALFDLGVSSMQLDEAERGFAFRHAGPLDMRMSGSGPSAADLLAEASTEQIAAWLHRYGEERESRRLARAIVAARDRAPILTTEALSAIVTAAMPGGPRRDHPARRTFQALRIVVNDELGALEAALAAAIAALTPTGRIAVLTYHSLEDRIVKHTFRDEAMLVPRQRRPLSADDAEIAANPRARSAKLRSAEKRGAS